MNPAGIEDDEALAREAAHWFARMRGPDAEASRPGFDAWLGESPEHRSAYNRASEVFAMGKLLLEPETEPAPRPRARAKPVTLALAALAACVVAVFAWLALLADPIALDGPMTAARGVEERRSVSTLAGETRTVRLADGSTVRLASDSMIEIAIGSSRRELRLMRGQARFEVAHEQRPFVVLAGGGSVTARGTIFDVGLDASGKVAVHLLEGAVDVALPQQRLAKDAGPVRRLAAGEAVSFASAPQATAANGAEAQDGASVPEDAAAMAGARDFDGATVATLVTEANRHAVRPIRLADPSLGARRVSGRFRVDDTGLLASRLAVLFGARVDTSDPKEIVLRRGPAK